VPKIELADGVSSLPRDEWNALVAEESPFLEWEWLASLEEAGCLGEASGWLPRPLVAREHGRLVAACPLYVKTNSEGEFVFDWGWADAAQRGGIDYYPKLLVGVPFTPVTGARILVAADQNRGYWLDAMAGTLRDTCLGNNLSGVHVNFCHRDESEALTEAGFLPRLGIQYHWHNDGYQSFDDYLGRFRSKRRNQIRRERRDVRALGVTVEALAGHDIPDELFDPMYRFYLSTIEARYYGRQYLNRELFQLVSERFRERLVFVVARCEGEVIAGTFNVMKGDAMYGRYWGCTRTVRNLHFELCYYASVEFCIERGLARFEPGAGGEYKQVRGFDAQPTWSGHFLRDEGLRAAVARFLQSERNEAERAIDWLREQSALKPAAT
jgi:predicted N-acyltransferase